MTPARRRPLAGGPAKGNALLMALLALAIMALTAVTALQSKRMDLKREAGLAEAGVLERVRNAAQALVDEQLVPIQRGEALVKNGMVLQPVKAADGALAWSPTIAQLRDMGYLPPGWSTTRSVLNDGAYVVSFRRTPDGCLGAGCDVVGEVVLTAPLRDAGRHSAIDGVLIGPILTRSGADGGVSLASNPAVITGFNGAWLAANPVPGAPAGVVAMRFGSQAGGLSQFVRIGDDRDPRLAGEFSVAGQGRFGSGLAVSGRLGVGGDEANPCVSLTPEGRVAVTCDGELSATRASIGTAGGGNTRIDPDGLSTDREIVAQAGLRTANAALFTAAEPTTVAVTGGPLVFRNDTTNLASFQDGSLNLPRNISADRLVLRNNVVEGQACQMSSASGDFASSYGATADGSIAACLTGRWVATHRFSRAGLSCDPSGALATSSANGEGLICRGGRYAEITALVSSFVLQKTLALAIDGGRAVVEKPLCSEGSGAAAEPLIFLIPNNEEALVSPATPNLMSGINRYAIDQGNHWTVVLERSADSVGLQGVLVAQIYCYYGGNS